MSFGSHKRKRTINDVVFVYCFYLPPRSLSLDRPSISLHSFIIIINVKKKNSPHSKCNPMSITVWLTTRVLLHFVLSSPPQVVNNNNNNINGNHNNSSNWSDRNYRKINWTGSSFTMVCPPLLVLVVVVVVVMMDWSRSDTNYIVI